MQSRTTSGIVGKGTVKEQARTIGTEGGIDCSNLRLWY